MLAVSDIPFRTMCKELGAWMTSTEMVSAKGIMRSSSRSFRYAVFSPDEHPIAIQIVAANPDDAAATIRELAPLKPDAFDLNFGCPNERICCAGAGANLLEDLPRMGKLIEAAVRASDIPVSVKTRIRGKSSTPALAHILQTVEQSGAAWITLHARARNTPYDIPADWCALREAVSRSSIPVVGNGDIFSADDAFRMMDETGCSAVMVGRGCLGTPWIFADIAAGRRCGIHEHAPSVDELTSMVSRHVHMLLREFGDVRAIPRIRKHVLWYSRFYEGTNELRKRLFLVDDAKYIIDTTLSFFSSHPEKLDPHSESARSIERAFRKRVLYWATEALHIDG